MLKRLLLAGTMAVACSQVHASVVLKNTRFTITEGRVEPQPQRAPRAGHKVLLHEMRADQDVETLDPNAPLEVAGLRMHGVTVAGCMLRPVDGGCLTQNQYVIDASGHQQQAAYIYSTNPCQFAYDSAQSGQLATNAPQTCVPGSTTNARNEFFHEDGINVPFVDPQFPIGPSADSTLIPLDQYVDSSGYGCAPSTTTNGMPYGLGQLGNNPIIYCRNYSAFSSTYNPTIRGVDMTRVGSEPSGTESGQVIYVPGSATQGSGHATLTIQNTKFGAWSANAHSYGPASFFLIWLENAAGPAPAEVDLLNDMFDCQFRFSTSPGNTGSCDAMQMDVIGSPKSATDPTVPETTLKVYNTLFYNMGRDPIVGAGTVGTKDFQNSWAFDIAAAGDHAEIDEVHTGFGEDSIMPGANYFNMGIWQAASQLTTDWTSAIYQTGAPNNVGMTSLTVNHLIAVTNANQCSNAPTITAGHPNGIYSPANPCIEGGTGLKVGNSIFMIGDAPIGTLTFLNGKGDAIATNNCVDNAPSAMLGGFSIKGSVGTAIYGAADVGGHYGIYPGMTVISLSTGDGFIPTTIASYGTAKNFPTFDGSVDGTTGILTTDDVMTFNLGVSTLLNIYGASPVPSTTVVTGSNDNGAGHSWTTHNGTGNVYGIGYQPLQAADSNANCTPGKEPQCGTYNMTTAQTNPDMVFSNLALVTTFGTIIDTIGGNPSNYVFVGGVAKPFSMQALETNFGPTACPT